MDKLPKVGPAPEMPEVKPPRPDDGDYIYVIELYGCYSAVCTTPQQAFNIRDELIEREGLEGQDVLSIAIVLQEVNKIL